MPFIYTIVNNRTQQTYVGKALNVKARWKAHRVDANRADPTSYIGRALRKHGVVNFNFTIVEECPSEEAAYAAEVRWISALGSISPGGYNLDSGGMGGKTASASL